MKELSIEKINVADITLIGLFAAITGVLSQIALPMPSGVPATLQTFAIAFCGFLLGKKKGTIAVLIYILIGIAGVPVFANFKSGINSVIGITGGFIYGFLFLSYFTGKSIEFKNKYLIVLFSFIGLIICHLLGVIQFSYLTKMDFIKSLFLVSVPYILKDVVSIALAYIVSREVKKRVKF